ncbi:WAT1-related protein At5g64700-like [Panicum virgatum]|uniref:WAT1-related protein At5g64700-like n=1 Tax=Panicum virgatum TaxID=38727 RepID=UPI0019D6024B|nr:WAT1-related protein At5g64700-like [Panicum virgatum]
MDDGSKKAYAVAISVQLVYTGMFVISKAAFDHGINTFVFMFYRQAAGSLLLLPLALLRHYRMEHVKLKSWSGVAKLTGVVLCLAGVLVIALYAGPSLSPVNHRRAFASHGSGPSGANVATRSAWVKWTFLMVLANTMWSLLIVLQAPLLEECPDKILVTAAQCVFSTAQSFVVAVVAERDFSRWKLNFDVSLLAIFYSGFVVMGLGYYLQAWCVEMKGPVFLAAWTPFCFIFTMFCSSFFLGEIVHLGSIVGAALLVGGLYSVLWGKSKEAKIEPCKEVTNKIDNPVDENIKQNYEEMLGEIAP